MGNPIRQESIAAHRMEKPHMSDLQSWKISYPKLKLFITLLCFGKPEVGSACLPIDTICQQIIFNSKQFSRTSRTKDTGDVINVRHPRNAECPIIHFMTIKLYSTVRSKTLIQILFSFDIFYHMTGFYHFLTNCPNVLKFCIMSQTTKFSLQNCATACSQYLWMITWIKTVHLLMQNSIFMEPECLLYSFRLRKAVVLYNQEKSSNH